MNVSGIGVRGMSSSRLRAVIKRYGQTAQLIGNPPQAKPSEWQTLSRDTLAEQPVHILTSDLTPLQDDDFAGQVITSEALLLIARKQSPPQPGNYLMIDHARWHIESVVPLGTVETQTYRLQIAYMSEVSA